MKRNRVIYALLSIGLIGGFFGHGMWAVGGKDTFVELFTGTFVNVFGATVSTATATSWVQAIGWFDIAITVALAIMLLGNLQGKGALYEFAYSKSALAIYAWGALWGFLTAGARVTAAVSSTPRYGT